MPRSGSHGHYRVAPGVDVTALGVGRSLGARKGSQGASNCVTCVTDMAAEQSFLFVNGRLDMNTMARDANRRSRDE